jgi:hypothetical protein
MVSGDEDRSAIFEPSPTKRGRLGFRMWTVVNMMCYMQLQDYQTYSLAVQTSFMNRSPAVGRSCMQASCLALKALPVFALDTYLTGGGSLSWCPPTSED